MLYVAAKSLVCYECLEGEYTEFCNLTATIKQCQGSEDVCFSQIRTSPVDATLLTSHKTCMNKRECEAKLANNPAHCATGVIDSTCTWCCALDQCNYDRTSYVIGTTTTLEPHSTTKVPTVTDCVPVATSNCTDLDLQGCVIQHNDDIESFLEAGNAGEICRTIPVILACLSEALESCYHPGGVASLLDNTLTSLHNVCPTGCNESALIECYYRLVSRVVRIILSPGGSCELLTREIEAHVHCVKLTISECDEAVRTKYEHLSGLLTSSVTTLCHALPPTIQQMASVGPMDLSTTSPLMPSGASRVTSFTTSTRVAGSTSSRPQSAQPTSTRVFATSTSTLPTPTEHPECRETVATACITELAHELVQLMTEQNPDYSEICSSKFIATLECARSNTEECSAFIRNRIEIAIQYLRELLGGACLMSTTPPGECDTQTARGCIVDLLTLAAESDPRRACLFRDNATACVERYTAGCTPDERQSLETVLKDVLAELDPRCQQLAQCKEEDVVVVIREGGASHDVHFSLAKPPSALCNNEPDCKIFVDFLSDDTDQTRRCRNKARQFVIGNINQATSGDDIPLCSREVTDENWTQELSVSLTAVVDLVRDGDQRRHLTIVLRKVVGGEEVTTWTLCTYLIIIIDTDTDSVCRVLNDPHIHTFDKTFYNNHYQGIFRLYQHTVFPYEVQAAFVQCYPGGPPTCMCAVYVRAGDTVFIANKCHQDLRTALYADDDVTPGMRIHASGGGRIIDIILPHGTRIRINDAETTLINIYIYPSPYDWEHTTGLCGFYDGDRSTDLVDSLGNFHDVISIRTAWNKMPKDVCASWRVPRDELLVRGYHGDAHVPPSFCACHYPEDSSDGVTVADCDVRNLVETCHLRLGRDVTRRFRVRPPRRLSARGRRALANMPEEDLIPDFDEDFDPALVEFTPTWSLEQARAYCWEYLREDDLVQNCLTVPGISLDIPMDICIEDIMYTGNTTWAPRARESLLETCEHELRTNSVYTDSSAAAILADIVLGMMCPGECSGFGECVQGECQCSNGRFGSDCALEMGIPPNITGVEGGSLCPYDVTDCSNIVISGEKFSETKNMSCHFEQISRLPTDSTVAIGDVAMESQVVLLSHQTISCSVPRDRQSYKVKVTLDGMTFSREVVYVPFNSQCFSCELLGDSDVTCTQKTDTCLVDANCYRTGENSPEDSCEVCAPEKSTSALTKKGDVRCRTENFTLTVILCAVVVLILIIAIIVCCVCYKKRKARRHTVKDAPQNEMSSVRVKHMSEV